MPDRLFFASLIVMILVFIGYNFYFYGQYEAIAAPGDSRQWNVVSSYPNNKEVAAAMNRVNPSVVLRNHLAEAAIRQAQSGDFSEVQRLLKVLQNPFDEAHETTADADFPPAWAEHIEVSCSS